MKNSKQNNSNNLQTGINQTFNSQSCIEFLLADVSISSDEFIIDNNDVSLPF